MKRNNRDLAMFKLAIDSERRGCVVVLANVSHTFGSPLFPFDDDVMKSGLCSIAVYASTR
jgi:hypothetical protein